jgi:ADP-heptose:LPS heptosyltransferase
MKLDFVSSFLKSGKHLAKKFLFWPVSPLIIYLLGRPLYRRQDKQANLASLNVSRVNNILIVRLDEIGDGVLMSPFLRELRRNAPRAWITLVVKPEVLNLVERCPYVNEILTYDWRGPTLILPYLRCFRALRLAKAHFWSKRYDLAISPRWDVDAYHASILIYLSGATWRWGYSAKVNRLKRSSNKGYDRFFTHAVDDRAVRHEVEYNLRILEELGGQFSNERLELWLSDDDIAFAQKVLPEANVSNSAKLRIALVPGAGVPNKQWPRERFLELAAWLKNTYDARLVILGGPNEENLGKIFRAELQDSVIDLTGKTTLRQAAAVLNYCHLCVSNDSGPLHLAAAGDIPVVEISAHSLQGAPGHSLSPKRFGPWKVPHRVVQPISAIPPCTEGCEASHPHCILGVTLDQIKVAVKDLLVSYLDITFPRHSQIS